MVALHEFLDEQAVHLAAAQEAFRGVDHPVHQGAIGFTLAVVELELPVEMASLPAGRVQARHHALRKGVDGDFINPLRQPFTPVFAVQLEGGLHGFPFNGMATVVAVAEAVRTLDCAETHGEPQRVHFT